jgi:hypothetical protein
MINYQPVTCHQRPGQVQLEAESPVRLLLVGVLRWTSPGTGGAERTEDPGSGYEIALKGPDRPSAQDGYYPRRVLNGRSWA